MTGLRSLALAAALATTSASTGGQTTAADLANRDRSIGWPEGFDPAGAQSFAHNRLTIAAPCPAVFGIMARPQAWPDWLVFVKDVRLPAASGILSAGSRFRWTIFGLPIESEVAIFEPARRIGWFSHSVGERPRFFQSWLFVPTSDGCDVVTEEVGFGPDAAKARQRGDTRTHRAHDLWLASLKWIAEGGVTSK